MTQKSCCIAHTSQVGEQDSQNVLVEYIKFSFNRWTTKSPSEGSYMEKFNNQADFYLNKLS